MSKTNTSTNVIDLDEHRPHLVIRYQPKQGKGSVHVVPKSWLEKYAAGECDYEPDMDRCLRAIVSDYFNGDFLPEAIQ